MKGKNTINYYRFYVILLYFYFNFNCSCSRKFTHKFDNDMNIMNVMLNFLYVFCLSTLIWHLLINGINNFFFINVTPNLDWDINIIMYLASL